MTEGFIVGGKVLDTYFKEGGIAIHHNMTCGFTFRNMSKLRPGGCLQNKICAS
jgi:hypothetical protein